MEEELAKSIVSDERLKETPSENKYGQYELSRDYVANGQIMVTITLAEYRELLCKHADDRVSESNRMRYTVERERDELKKQVDSLEKELSSLKTMIASAVPMSGSTTTAPGYQGITLSGRNET